MDAETYSRSRDASYDAAVSADGWPGALNLLGKMFASHRVALVDRNLETMHGTAIGMDAADRIEYFDVWRDKNIYNTRTPVWQAGEIITGDKILPVSELLRSDYYNGFLKPRDSFHLLRISLSVEDHTHQSISLTRSQSAEAFEKSDIELATRLLPHLRRAGLITHRLQEWGGSYAGMANLLDDNPTGIVLLSSAGKVIFANRTANEMAAQADSFILRHDRLEALREVDDARLQPLIRGACGHSEISAAPRGGPLRLPRKSGFRDYAVVVAPLSIASEAVGQRGAVACLMITDPEATARRPRSILRRIYGLTEAEARMAERVVAGERLGQAAEALGIKASTARVHLAALFRKTETHRQAELMRVLLSLPWSEGG
ncbi:MAG TPA: LuxR C-terminal-related transcriptional regulator [Stellaceae bacterium]|nr:LuxR C-terminal-related transcriptional regulator [Stellaceae bacterium]